jgi:preprotein translocase subunit SecG
MLRIALTIVQFFAAAGIIGLVLLQRGKGADAGAGFGAGASGTVFGARGATTALSRATAILAAVFMVNSLALAYMGTREPTERPKTFLDQAATPETPAPATGTNAPAPAAQTPAPAAAAPAGAAPTSAAPQGTAPQSGAPAPATNTPSPTPQQ